MSENLHPIHKPGWPLVASRIQEAIRGKLEHEATLFVDTALLRFLPLLSHPSSSVSISLTDAPPTSFISLDTLDSCYEEWLTYPTPDRSQVSRLSDLARRNGQASVRVAYGLHVMHAPALVLDLWPQLEAIVKKCRAWADAKSELVRLSNILTGVSCESAMRLATKTVELPLDAPIPKFASFRTSFLPDLICDTWLSDEHLNAGGNFINAHPSCPSTIHALNSFFIETLRLRFLTGASGSRLKSNRVDQLVSNGTIVHLLIPVHRTAHWVLLHVNVKARTYSYADSLDPSLFAAPPSVIDPFNEWLTFLSGNYTVLTPVPHAFKVNRQEDSHSCGVAVLSSMAHFAVGELFEPWTQSSAKHHRLKWAERFSDLLHHSDLYIDPIESETDVFYHYLNDIEATPASKPRIEADRPCSPAPPTNSPRSLEETSCQHQPSSKRVCLIQTRLPFKSIPRDEWLIAQQKAYLDRKAESANSVEYLKQAALRKQLSDRTYERNRKRRYRAKQKNARQKLDEGAQKGRNLEPLKNSGKDQESISALTRPYSIINATISRHEEEGAVSNRKEPLKRTTRINWSHPLVWGIINTVAINVGYPWSPTEIVRQCQQLNPTIFASLIPQRISQWRDHQFPDELRWTEAHQRTIHTGCRPNAGKRQHGIFRNNPEAIGAIKRQLTALRASGVPLQLRRIRGYMVGVIQHHMPDAFNRSDRSGRVFTCSIRYVRHFLHKELGWSVRKATRAAQKLPPNVNTVLTNAFLRFACVIRDEDIPACCIVNADQTQVVFNPGSGQTWNPCGERQVHVLGVEDKRAFTLLVSASASGDLLPFQAIYTGKSNRSLPSPDSPGYTTATGLGFILESSLTNTYWSTLRTMKSWADRSLAPYFIRQIKQNGLPPNQQCILQIDCWSVHKSSEFRTWMAEKYPWITLQYVPGGCTGLFQPCDVGLQRILKIAIENAAHDDVVNETLAMLESGTPAENIVNDQSLPTLRDRSINWMLSAYSAINKPEIVKKAFSLCAVPGTDFNLSFESLTSRAARQAILDLRTSNPDLYLEITSGRNNPSLLSLGDEPDIPELDNGDNDDNAAIEEVKKQVHCAHTAADANSPLEEVPEFDESDYESEDDSTPIVPARVRMSARLLDD